MKPAFATALRSGDCESIPGTKSAASTDVGMTSENACFLAVTSRTGSGARQKPLADLDGGDTLRGISASGVRSE